jgi:hypothetical protein
MDNPLKGNIHICSSLKNAKGGIQALHRNLFAQYLADDLSVVLP